jgi:DNA-binding CsgD family transcriptional regulator
MEKVYKHAPDRNMDEEEMLHILANTTRALGQSMKKSIYLVDYRNHSILYVSDGIEEFFGTGDKGIGDKAIDFYASQTSTEEFRMFTMVRESALRFLDAISPKERAEYSFLCSLRIKSNVQDRLIMHKETPIVLNNEGRTRFSLCTISASSCLHSQIPMVKKENDLFFFEYSFENHTWKKQKEITLNENERMVLQMSAQGYTMKEIANCICKSIDSVKTYKRHLFLKMHVRNIREAITYARNHQLISL